MRLIDADALLKKMYKYSDNEGAKMPYGDDDSLIHRDSVCFLIEEAPTITPESHWIPVTERLPKVKQRVIAQYEDGSMEIRKCIDAGHLQWFYARTVAWMPSPEPFKGVT